MLSKIEKGGKYYQVFTPVISIRIIIALIVAWHFEIEEE